MSEFFIIVVTYNVVMDENIRVATCMSNVYFVQKTG